MQRLSDSTHHNGEDVARLMLFKFLQVIVSYEAWRQNTPSEWCAHSSNAGIRAVDCADNQTYRPESQCLKTR